MLHAARTPENVTSFISLLYHKFINFWGFRCCQYKLHILIDSWNPDETFKLSHPKKMPSKSKSQNENEIKGTKLYWELKNQCNDKNRYAACDRKIFLESRHFLFVMIERTWDEKLILCYVQVYSIFLELRFGTAYAPESKIFNLSCINSMQGVVIFALLNCKIYK